MKPQWYLAKVLPDGQEEPYLENRKLVIFESDKAAKQKAIDLSESTKGVLFWKTERVFEIADIEEAKTAMANSW